MLRPRGLATYDVGTRNDKRKSDGLRPYYYNGSAVRKRVLVAVSSIGRTTTAFRPAPLSLGLASGLRRAGGRGSGSRLVEDRADGPGPVVCKISDRRVALAILPRRIDKYRKNVLATFKTIYFKTNSRKIKISLNCTYIG